MDFGSSAFDTSSAPRPPAAQPRAPVSRDVGFSTTAAFDSVPSFDTSATFGRPSAPPAAAQQPKQQGQFDDPFAFANPLAPSTLDTQQQRLPATPFTKATPGVGRAAAAAPAAASTIKPPQPPVHHVIASGAGAVPGAPTGFQPIPRPPVQGTRQADPFATFTNGLLPPKKVQPEVTPMRPSKSAGNPGTRSAFGLLPQPRSPMGPMGLWRTVSDPPPMEHWLSTAGS